MQLPNPSESGSFETPPAGTHTAICYRFVERGTRKSEYMGETKMRHEVMLTWELCDEPMLDGRPFSVSRTYTWSMNEKATLRRDLESWRGKKFEDADFKGPDAFDTRRLLGVPCMLTITHDAKDGQTYAKITGIGKLTKGIAPPPLRNPKTYLALAKDGWDATVFGSLSEKMKASISETPEYRELMKLLRKPDEYSHPGDNGRDIHDEIPF